MSFFKNEVERFEDNIVKNDNGENGDDEGGRHGGFNQCSNLKGGGSSD